MVTVTGLEKNARAAKAGVRVGDVLVAINGHEIYDVLDYRFYLAEIDVTLSLTRDGVPFEVKVPKEVYDDIGLLFETPLMDKKQSCANRCIFCFIDQLPEGLRPSLYFKDDDARLSFLHGNYVTMTNFTRRDVDRIIEMHISPINISVHTTDRELRCKMMKNKRAGDVLSYMAEFADAGIRMCGQIVLCRGVNDGDELNHTMWELAEYHPQLSSVSIVPAGLTRFREGLYPLKPFTPEECRAVIEQVEKFGDECQKKLGNRIFHCADEFYLKAGKPIPDGGFYGDYEQIENGVGMLRSLIDEFCDELEYLGDYLPPERLAAFTRRVSLVTGKAAAATMRLLAGKLCDRVPGLSVQVFEIENNFFGPEITVAGLLTGKDVAEQLAGKSLGDQVLIPAAMLRAEGDLFLCGMTPAELEEKLATPLSTVGADGSDLLAALLGVPSPY